MPGQRHNDYSYRYLTSLKYLRQTSVADDTSAAGINAIPEFIPMHQLESMDPSHGRVTMAYDNFLQLAVLFPETVKNVTIQVYGLMTIPQGQPTPPNPVGADAWALVAERKLPRGAWVGVRNIPLTYVKVVVANRTGTGDVTILYSRSE